MSRIFGKVISPYSLDQVLQTGNSARDRHMEDVSNILFSDGGNYQNDTAIISQDITTLFFEINDLDTSVNLIETKLDNPVIIGAGAGAGNVIPVAGCVAIGNNAGSDSQQSNAICIGTNSGLVQQGSSAIAIGENCGSTQQGQYAIAIGAGSGGALQGQDAIAIGYTAGAIGQQSGAIAIGGTSANGLQQAYAVALGYGSGTASSSGQGASSVAIGHLAGGTDGTNDQPANSIALNASGLALLPTGASQTHIAPVRENNIAPTYILQYDPATCEVYRSNSLISLMGQFYKTASQNFSSGNLHITYDAHKDWTDFSAISQRDASNFEVNISGVYYLDFNVSVNPGGATWTNSSKTAMIDLNRGGTELAITAQYGFQNSGVFYALSTNCIYELFPGDIVNTRTVSSHTGTMNIANIASGFDLNTYFTWRLIKTLP